MKIGSSNIEQLGTGATGAIGGAAAESRAAAGGSAKSDSVNLSSAASLVALAKASAGARQAQVESIGSQVRSGTYQSDTAEVSHAVVQGHIG